jgi:uncharacterized membrane protein
MENRMSTSLADTELLARHQPSSFTSRYYSRREESNRCLMMAGGVGLALVGLANRSVAGLLLAGVGAALAYRSADCSHRWSEPSTSLAEESSKRHFDNVVDEASYDSFPASDPPAYSGS